MARRKRPVPQTQDGAQANGEEAKGRKPDFHVWAVDKKTSISGDIGCAWANEDGTVRIKLNPFVLIDTGVQDLLIRLYRAKE